MVELKKTAGTNSVSRIFHYRPEGIEPGDAELVGLEIQLNEQGALDEALRVRAENELTHPGLARINFLYVRARERSERKEALYFGCSRIHRRTLLPSLILRAQKTKR
jgi:hypothetical protein